ncbi:MAG: hypothetical protein JJ863_03385 [Deltaproteobacteria bacterium]|nr:hypothetical protein [Deltaproteobacteria bacterium]
MAHGATDDDSAPSDAPPAESDGTEVPMAKVPVLAGIAAAAAIVELIGARFSLRIEGSREFLELSHQQLLELKSWAAFARNLGAVAALVALAFTLADWIKPRPFLSMGLRIGIAAIAGVLLPTLVLSTMLPEQRTTLVVVLVATGSAQLLAVLFGIGAIPWRAPRLPRLGVTGIIGASFFAFTATVVLVIGAQTLWQHAHPLGMALRRTGEVSFLVTVPLLALSGLPLKGWRKVGIAIGALLGSCAIAAVSRGATVLEPEAWGDVLYGATHFELLLENASAFYIGWIGLTTLAGVAALFHENPRDQQKGLAALLLMAGGFSPTTPGTIIPMILGVSLACRALIAHAAEAGRAAHAPKTEPAE